VRDRREVVAPAQRRDDKRHDDDKRYDDDNRHDDE
jgi:hypothetical protein